MTARMQQHHVAFGLAATTVALKARTGQLRMQDQLDFSIRALEFVADDDLARMATVDFLTHCRRDPVGAGMRLQDFVLSWSEGAIQPKDAQLVLSGILSAAPPPTAGAFTSSRART